MTDKTNDWFNRFVNRHWPNYDTGPSSIIHGLVQLNAHGLMISEEKKTIADILNILTDLKIAKFSKPVKSYVEEVEDHDDYMTGWNDCLEELRRRIHLDFLKEHKEFCQEKRQLRQWT